VTFAEGNTVIVKRWTGTRWEQSGEAVSNQFTGERLGLAVNGKDKAIITWSENTDSSANVYVKQQK
jgi:hypothetical protein